MVRMVLESDLGMFDLVALGEYLVPFGDECAESKNCDGGRCDFLESFHCLASFLGDVIPDNNYLFIITCHAF